MNDPRSVIRSWAYDPERFVREALKVKQITAQQSRALLEAQKIIIAKTRKSGDLSVPWQWKAEEEERYACVIGLSIMSGQGAGKDALASWLILHFLVCFPYPKVPCTASTGHQLKDVLWAEINKWLRNSAVKDLLVWQTEKIYWKEIEGREWFAIARTANPKATLDEQVETLAGRHEDYMLVVVDEATGVLDPVFRPIEGGLTGKKVNYVLLIFNPTRSQGFAINSQFQDRDNWICLRWNSEESDIVSRESIERMAKKYGKDSNAYRIRVLGLPPKTGDRVLIEWDWAESAIDRETLPADTDPEVFAIDVGAGQDDTILYRRRGPVLMPAEVLNSPDSEVVTGWCAKRIFDYEPKYVFIDSIGVGWAVAGNLQARCPNTDIIAVNVADAAAENDRFYRLRDELLWRVREEFESRVISIPDDPILIGEMTSIHYDDERTDGKIKVESKTELRKRGMESTNRLDALALTEYFGVHTMRHMASRRSRNWRRETTSWRTI